ncbi:UDP-glucuronosyltransferase 2C1-like isoform X2 [Anguilla rostrata]|uniref:UDP-glucuronosyltransferase 2C1-like isoform X2 n=1 Tax=Anguilla rostrata TaxID=7938 RepID=UPI0030D39536
MFCIGQSVSVLVLVLCLAQHTYSGKVLLWPGEYSHWLNMKNIMTALLEKGHQITVLINSGTPTIKANQSSNCSFEIIPVSFTPQDTNDLVDEMLLYSLYEHDSYIQAFLKIKAIFEKTIEKNKELCLALFKNKELLEKLRRAQYDVVVADPMFFGSELLAETLDLPFVISFRASFGNTVERLCGQLPAPPSYVPGTGMHYTDEMDFSQRLKNSLYYFSQDMLFHILGTMTLDTLFTEMTEFHLLPAMFCIGHSVSVLVLVLCLAQHTYSGKVLLWPGEYSHWLNMKNIMTALLEKGHQITVLINSGTPTIKANQSSNCSFEIIPVSFTPQDTNDLVDEMLLYSLYEHDSYIQAFLKFKAIFEKTIEKNKEICLALFKNKELLEKLRRAQYDVVVADPMFFGSELLAETLDLPFVISFRASFGNTVERLCGQLPAPPSYVPGKPTSFCEVIGKADIWLIRTYWDFEYPRPFLPNFKFVGGLHCKPAKPLPEDMEEFVQTSGEDGVVVFSLGSMVKNLTKERRNTIASALGQVPQKVLWRYSGEKPDTLAPNTRVYDWIPQNDLLGHPKTKVFITHGGTNGIYEGIYHGVPMVGIPLFGDQSGNMLHMKTKGAAVILDFNHFQAQDLVDAVNTVVKDPSYKESAMRLSRIHHDQPMKPLDRAVFWIEFVMRNKGAKHLRVQSHNLSWYQYHCLDVLAALLATVVLVTLIIFKSCCFCVRKCCLRSKAKSKKE